MILILGTGYIAQAFAKEFQSRKLNYDMVSRRVLDYPTFSTLAARLNFKGPKLLVNAAGFCGTPNVDEVESRQAEAILSNVVLPTTISNAAALMQIPWIHISSGCIYDGMPPEQPLEGFSEKDEPNFTFNNTRCSFYSGTKALAERVISGTRNCWICRLRMPFDENESPKNLLTKLQRYPKIYDSPLNSLSHLGDSVRACVDLWDIGAKPGIYNVVNPGPVSNLGIASLIQEHLNPSFKPEFFKNDAEFYAKAAKAPRSNCVLSSEKLLNAGVKMRPVIEALTDSLDRWKAS